MEQKINGFNENIAEYYDRKSTEYDTGYSSPLCKAEDRAIMQVIRPFITGGSMLDIGCGTGIALDYLDPKDYLGLDVSPGMISKARSKYPDRNFVVGDMLEVVKNFESDSYENIVSLYGPLSYSLEPKALVKEFHRILKPGGIMMVMPYTKRVERNLFVGEYSTATEDTIDKIYYTTDMLMDLFSDFSYSKAIGINYFGNFIEELDRGFGKQQDVEFYANLLATEQSTVQLPIEYARHCLVVAQKSF